MTVRIDVARAPCAKALGSRLARSAGPLIMLLTFEGEGTAQTWQGPWDWTACTTTNPCGGQGLFPEFSHAALIPTGLYRGKVMMWRRDFDATCAATVKTYAYIFDPLAPNELLRNIDVIDSELLCAGSSWDPNGRLIVVGGNRVAPALLDDAYRFEPGSLGAPIGGGCNLRIANRVWQGLNDMVRPRFYPTILSLTKATIFYDASAAPTCTSIVGGAHLVLGGPHDDAGHAPVWTTIELLPYGSTQWACPVDALGSTPPLGYPPAPTHYSLNLHPNEPTTPAPPGPFDGELSSYPRAFQLSNGDVLIAHDVETAPANQPQQWFVLRFNQPGTHKFEFWRGLVDATHAGPSSDRNYGTAVLMHMVGSSDKDRVIVLGGSAPGSDPVATVQEFIPGTSSTAPGGTTVNGSWFTKTSLLSPRAWSNAVILPDGTILMSGGTSKFISGVAPIANAEVYDPGPARTSPGSSVPMPPPNGVPPSGLPTQRLYHSFSLLLADGSVFIGGGEEPAVQPAGFAIGPYSGEIFQPPYMPQTTGLEMPYIASVGSEQPMRVPGGTDTFDITVENCKSTEFTVVGVVLTRPAAGTHFFDNDQRYIELERVSETQSGGGVDVTVRSLEDNLGPPGWYMLWVIVNHVGSTQKLPTHAEWVRFF